MRDNQLTDGARSLVNVPHEGLHLSESSCSSTPTVSQNWAKFKMKNLMKLKIPHNTMRSKMALFLSVDDQNH